MSYAQYDWGMGPCLAFDDGEFDKAVAVLLAAVDGLRGFAFPRTHNADGTRLTTEKVEREVTAEEMLADFDSMADCWISDSMGHSQMMGRSDRIDAIRSLILRQKSVEKLAESSREAIRYFRHVQGWSTHGPADINAQDLADELEGALAAYEEAKK